MHYGIKVGPFYAGRSTRRRKNGSGGAVFVVVVLALAAMGWVYSTAGAVAAWVLGVVFVVLAVLLVVGAVVEKRE